MDAVALATDLRAQLTGPGGAFELAVHDVRGAPLPVFVHRRAALRDWLVDSAQYADREYLVQGERRLTYDEHLAAVAALADVLSRYYGVRPGDRVAILAANSPDWVVTFWAAIALGAIAVAGNPWWTAPEAEYSLRRTRPRVVVADTERAALFDGLGVPVLPMDDVPGLIAARGVTSCRTSTPARTSRLSSCSQVGRPGIRRVRFTRIGTCSR